MKLSHIELTAHVKQILSEVCSYVKLNNSVGHYDTNLFLEDLVLLLLNETFGYQLENLNHKVGKTNVEGIDLIDESNKICVQVSSRTDLTKIKNTVNCVAKLEGLDGYHLIYFALTEKSNKKRTQYLPCGKTTFSFSQDYYDFSSIIKLISSRPSLSSKIYNILKDWVGESPIDQLIETSSTQSIANLEEYYPRIVSIPAENEYQAYFQKEQYPSDTLYNFVSGKVSGFENKKLWLLVSAAQVGKSHEAINLFHKLQSDDTNYPILIKARDFNNDAILLPFYAPLRKMVLIVDGFDEPREDKRNRLHRIVEDLSKENSELRIVITCRRNYINSGMLASFQRLNLESLTLDTIKNVIKNNAIDFGSFSDELISRNLWELAFEPFYLNSLISIYRTNDSLPSDRMDIIKTIISKSYETDDSIFPAGDMSSETYGDSMLSKIAFVLQLSERKELTETELIDSFRYDKDKISHCLRFAIFKRSEDKKYSFTKNIFLNYFVVRMLLNKTADEILKLAELRDAEYSCVNPAWLDVFELLMASLDKKGDTYKQLVEWLSKHDKISIISLDPHSLPRTVVISTFKDLLIKYKRLGISGPNDYNSNFHRRLANHCIYRESLELIISEYESVEIKDSYGYLLFSTVAALSSDIIQAYGIEDKLIKITLEHIRKNVYADEEKWFIYVPLGNKVFHNSKTVDYLIGIYHSSNQILLKEIVSLISGLDDVDEYINFITENIGDNKRHKDTNNVRRPIDEELVDLVFSKIKKAHNLSLAMNCMAEKWIAERGHTSSEEKAYNSFINLLTVIERSMEVDVNAELLELIESTWEKILIKRVFSGALLQKVFCTIRTFVTKYNDAHDKLATTIQKMSVCLKEENAGLKLREHRAIISLYISPDDVDRIASEMDCSIDNMFILDWIKSGLDPEIDSRVDFWLDSNFKQFRINQAIDWDKHEEDSRQVLIDHDLFISTIKELLKDSGETPICKYLSDLEHKDIPTNTYIYWFCQTVENELKSNYSSIALIAKAEDKHYYDDFRIEIIGNHNLSITLSDQQKKELEVAINDLIETATESVIIACLIIAIRYDIRLPEHVIIENLKYAALTPDNISQCDSPNNFFSYAIRHLTKEQLDRAIQSLLEVFKYENNQLHLLQLTSYVIKERLFRCMPQVINIACDPRFYYSHIIVDSINSIGEKGNHIIKQYYNTFPPSLQLYAIRYIRESEDMQDEIISCMKNIRTQDSDDNSRLALFYLLSIGDNDSLIDLLNICKSNPTFLGDLCDAPSLHYSSIEDLPILIEILKISHDFKAQFNQWPSQCIRAIKYIALIKDENTDIVIDSLRNLVSESSDYLWINYQIESIQQGRLQRHSNPLSVKNAIKLINHDL